MKDRFEATQLVLTAVFLGAGLIVTVHLWSGYMVLPDFATGPANHLPSAFWGLGQDGRTDGIVPQMVAFVGRGLLGSHLFGWLALCAFFPIAGLGAARVVGGSLWRQMAAGLVFCVNPFVADRMIAGQVGVLWGMALLGWAYASWSTPPPPAGTLSAEQQSSRVLLWRLRAGLWLAVLTACSVHFAWIGGAALLCAVAGTGARRWRDMFVALGVAIALFGYLLIPSIAGVVHAQVGNKDVLAYHTSTDAFHWLGLALLSGGGFWRNNPSAAAAAGWVGAAAGLAILVVLVLGAVKMFQTSRRRTYSVLALAGIGLVGAAGSQGPTGALWRFAFHHVPTFAILREPQKFLVLYVLAVAIFVGWGMHAVERLPQVQFRLVALGAVMVAVVSFTPTLFHGANGDLKAVQYPTSWRQANTVMGNGSGRILALPWHGYAQESFAKQPSAAVLESFFTRPLVVSRNPELPGLHTEPTAAGRYVASLVAHASSIHHLGALVAPLGVEYVILTQSDDAAHYTWLANQQDLRVVYHGPGIQVWQNTAYSTSRLSGLVSVSDIQQLIVAANQGELVGRAAVIVPHQPLSITHTSPSVSGKVASDLPIQYAVSPGQGQLVGLPELYDPSWHLQGHSGFKTAAGTVAFYVGPGAHTIRFGGFDWVVAGYAETLFVLLLVAGALVLLSLHRPARGPKTQPGASPST